MKNDKNITGNTLALSCCLKDWINKKCSYITFLSQLNFHKTKGGKSMTFHKVNSTWFQPSLWIQCVWSITIFNCNNIMLHSLSVNFLVFSLKPLLQGQGQGFSVQQDIILSLHLDSDCGLRPLSFISPCNIIMNPIKVTLILHTLH